MKSFPYFLSDSSWPKRLTFMMLYVILVLEVLFVGINLKVPELVEYLIFWVLPIYKVTKTCHIELFLSTSLIVITLVWIISIGVCCNGYN